MTEMIERVARAIAGSHDDWYGNEKEWVARARAAIAAMREPTWGMGESGLISLCRSDGLPGGFAIPGGVAEDCWRAMIDEALK